MYKLRLVRGDSSIYQEETFDTVGEVFLALEEFQRGQLLFEHYRNKAKRAGVEYFEVFEDSKFIHYEGIK